MSAIQTGAVSPPANNRKTELPAGARLSAMERRFYSGFALAALICVAIGFSRSFYLKPILFADYPAPPESIFIAHGLLFSSWMVLLVAQTRLIATRSIGWHRRLGVVAAALAAVMVVLGAYVGLVAAHRPGGFINSPIPPLQFLVVPLVGISLFALFVSLAIVRRQDGQAHKRLMLVGTLQMMIPGIARWPGVAALGPLAFFSIADLFVIALALFDIRTRGRLHPVTLWGGALTIIAQPLQLALSGTQAWLTFARWATSFLGA